MTSQSVVVHSHSPFTGFQRLLALLSDEKRDIFLLVAYTIVIGLLFLVTPLTAQALVNTIAAGVLVQPLFILTGLLLMTLLFVAALRSLQIYLVELLQRRIFSRIALKLSYHVPRVLLLQYKGQYGPELLNRFFDTLTIQKSISKLLIEAPTAFFQILIGLTLMGIYSPLFLVFDLCFIGALVILVLIGRGGANTAYAESTQKYQVASWLEDIARCQMSMKLNGLPSIIQTNTDRYVINYLDHRESHFRVILRQSVWTYVIQAVATAGILAIGGWLVINRQLTLGQLVAAELVMVTILGALDKLAQELDIYYDLLTGLSKVGMITDMELERADGVEIPSNPEGARIECKNVIFRYPNKKPILNQLNLTIEPGSRVSIVGRNGAGKSSLAYLITGLLEANDGMVLLNGMDMRRINLNSVRKNCALVSESSAIFEGTIEENIILGRQVSDHDLLWALDTVELQEELAVLPKGIKTKLASEGKNLSLGQRQRIIIARAILERPQFLVLDEAFTGIDQHSKLKIITNLFKKENGWTIVDISHDMHIVLRTQYVYLIQDGKIREEGSINVLAHDKDSALLDLFPELAFFMSV